MFGLAGGTLDGHILIAWQDFGGRGSSPRPPARLAAIHGSEDGCRCLGSDPADSSWLWVCGLWGGDQRASLDGSIEAYRRTLEIEPSFANSHFALSNVLAITGRFEEAATAFRRAADLFGHDQALSFAILYARWGQDEEARRFLARALEPGQPGYIQPTHVAIAYTTLGEHNEAIRRLCKGLAEGAPYMGELLKTDPSYDPLRAEPGFQSLLRQLKLDR